MKTINNVPTDNIDIRFPIIDLENILIPWSKCYCISLGPISIDTIDEMKLRDFDYAPVSMTREQSSLIVGLISRNDLEIIQRETGELEKDEQKIIDFSDAELWLRPDLEELLKKMAQLPAWFVYYEGDAGEYGTLRASYGLITRSDLNKHHFRSIIYEIFAELETLLAEFVLISNEDHLNWIRRLSEDSQARILGYWELSKLENVNTGPVTGATLSDLLNVIAKDSKSLSVLGYKSRNSFEKNIGLIPGIRNQIMHPVRPLINSGESCTRLSIALREMLSLTEKLRHFIDQKRTKSNNYLK
jgi:hypothetical protein